MAVNAPLGQQRSSVESRIKILVNNDLKEICKAYGYQVSGNKVHLQQRCIEILSNIVDRDDRKEFEKLNYRVNNHGRTPPEPVASSVSHLAEGKGPYALNASSNNPLHSRSSQTFGRSNGPRQLPPTTRLFKPNPFYEILDTVLRFDVLPEFPNNRNTVTATLRLRHDTIQSLQSDPLLRLMLYCGVDQGLLPTTPPIDIAFPGQLEIKINEDDVKHNFKGLKNKPGSTKPVDITDKIRQKADYGNRMVIVYALTQKRYVYGVLLVRHVSAATLTERIKQGKFIPKQTVLDEMNRANADPDIAATSVRMSLKDPISTMRITTPVRSDRCSHNQCFDVSMFLQLQEQAPQWTCPVCNRSVVFESLRVDKYFEEILNTTNRSIEKVDIEPNGDWHIIKEEEDTQTNGPASRAAPRAAYDDDFDDDLEVVEIKSESTPNGLNNGVLNRPTPSCLPVAGKQMDTPPLSSREPSVAQSTISQQPQGTKRPMTVIDLISSDEDEPPRPAKRQSTSMPLRNPAASNTTTNNISITPSYNSPIPLPDHARPPHAYRNHQVLRQQESPLGSSSPPKHPHPRESAATAASDAPHIRVVADQHRSSSSFSAHRASPDIHNRFPGQPSRNSAFGQSDLESRFGRTGRADFMADAEPRTDARSPPGVDRPSTTVASGKQFNGFRIDSAGGASDRNDAGRALISPASATSWRPEGSRAANRWQPRDQPFAEQPQAPRFPQPGPAPQRRDSREHSQNRSFPIAPPQFGQPSFPRQASMDRQHHFAPVPSRDADPFPARPSTSQSAPHESYDRHDHYRTGSNDAPSFRDARVHGAPGYENDRDGRTPYADRRYDANRNQLQEPNRQNDSSTYRPHEDRQADRYDAHAAPPASFSAHDRPAPHVPPDASIIPPYPSAQQPQYQYHNPTQHRDYRDR